LLTGPERTISNAHPYPQDDHDQGVFRGGLARVVPSPTDDFAVYFGELRIALTDSQKSAGYLSNVFFAGDTHYQFQIQIVP